MIKVFLVDDEPGMLLAMKRMLAKLDGVELVGSFRKASDALEFVRERREADLAFLDIKIQSEDGLDLARSLREERPDLEIVFTTSHADYSLEAYEVYPLDYMIKPVSSHRLAQTMRKAADRRRGDAARDEASRLETARAEGLRPSERLTIRGFGGFEAYSEQGGAVKWISKKSKELFAYLLTQQGRSVSKARILEDVFPDMPIKNAETYLNTAMYQLRKALSPHGLKETVQASQEQYQADASRAEADFVTFESEMTQFAQFTASNEDEAIELESRYTGELFENQPFAWATLERERLRMAYESYAMRLARHLYRRGRFPEAARIAGKLAARNEFDEECAFLLFQLLEALGESRALQQYYERYARILREELGERPSERIRQFDERRRR